MLYWEQNCNQHTAICRFTIPPAQPPPATSGIHVEDAVLDGSADTNNGIEPRPHGVLHLLHYELIDKYSILLDLSAILSRHLSYFMLILKIWMCSR